MLRNWHQTLAKTLIWMVVEVYLDFVGLDNLADYSEFVFERHCHQSASQMLVVVNVIN
ncbi:hypothetical protein [Merismopedia glauca]|uniref:hypothetical protein n=1 Tax=Merismopedia glauca TaxID=292586 RepID=UPI0015E71D8C|nr:hypothetical protein [Merismopedia glauca]